MDKFCSQQTGDFFLQKTGFVIQCKTVSQVIVRYYFLKKKKVKYLSSGEFFIQLAKRNPILHLKMLYNGPSCSKLTTSLVNDSLKFT